MSIERRIKLAVVGLGYWGPNLARNFAALDSVELAWVCDASEERLFTIGQLYPGARRTTRLEDVLQDPDCEAVVIATPVPTHADAAEAVLRAGKHCFIEKPLAQTAADAERVVEAAHSTGNLLMVGHLLEFHPGVTRLNQMCESGELGEIRYIYGNRLNLGKIRSEENALWSLGAHDVSVLLKLMKEEPIECQAFGASYMNPGVEDVVFCFLRFPNGAIAHLHLSWLDPHKERRFTVVGSDRMATFDDMAAEGKLTVYDKGFDPNLKDVGQYIQRSGDIWSPQISTAEPLRIECQHFVDSIISGTQPAADGDNGLRVVRVLEQLEQSLAAQQLQVVS